jgi:hypothetical protein
MPAYNVTVTDTAATHESVHLKVHSCVHETANASDIVSSGRGATISDSMTIATTVTARRGTIIHDTARAAESVVGRGHFAALLEDSAHVHDLVVGSLTLHVHDTAAAAETVIGKQAIHVRDAVIAHDTVTPHRKSLFVYVDPITAHDLARVVKSLVIHDTAAIAEVVLATRRQHAVIAETAAAATNVTGHRRTHASVVDQAHAHEAVTSRLHARQTVTDSAVAEDYVRVPSEDTPQFWTNTTTGAAGVWVGLPINSLFEKDGRVYAATDAGLVELVPGAGTANASLLWDLMGFRSVNLKRVDVGYVAGVAKAPLSLRATTKDGSYAYRTHIAAAKDQNMRVQMGKGLLARYMRFELTNPGGSDFAVDDVNIELHEVQRRR